MTTPSPTPILLQPNASLRTHASTSTIAPERMAHDGRARAVVEAVLPAVDAGRFAVKCVAGEPFVVTAHCFTDGHDVLRVMLCWRADDATPPVEVPMVATGNDEWRASFLPPASGRYYYTVTAWVDSFDSWRRELVRRVDPEDICIAARVGAIEIAAAAHRAEGEDQAALVEWAQALEDEALAAGAVQSAERATKATALKALALDSDRAELIARYPDRRHEFRYPTEFPLVADRERARYSTWYELFPRSTSPVPGAHGTLRDVENRLPAIAAMGFDVLYFPPIHPIGRVQRKGKNNALTAQPGDVGSPWAIGAAEGGHKAILPELGTAEDFRRLVGEARRHGLEIALDIAFQCAPDHPYVEQHPDWFRWRPDGTVQYAENPPKKYQDIYPFNFACDDWQGLWTELKSVFEHWIGEGVHIFRVDNPHTKAFPFWEWVITEIKRNHPDVLFLAEAFTRPKVMHGLAKRGFSQSYTYYTWRNTKEELTAYFIELSSGPGKDYFRPNVWPNTPDILNEHLHGGEPAVFMSRLVLAATLAASYGIYGPAYELLEHDPREPGSEEYLHSEKYQLRHWDHDRPDNLRDFITRVNRIRRENPALHSDNSLRFLSIDNNALIAYAKRSPDGRNTVVTVVNLDPHNAQSGWVNLSAAWVAGAEAAEEESAALAPAPAPAERWQMHDLLSNQRFVWQGDWHFVQLDPHRVPAHVFLVRRHVRREHDFDFFE
ncbi:MAG: alpha-1,4-glucan--maltose-1-phosphate maltosyltransferase [Acidovorax sp.]|nr:MAG: alpha-1,4-glucan--maltose-1-phosphate maltosyltransferase [Acidovorax sp.]